MDIIKLSQQNQKLAWEVLEESNYDKTPKPNNNNQRPSFSVLRLALFVL